MKAKTEIHQDIISLHKKGLTTPAIAKQLNVSSSTIYRFLKKNNLKSNGQTSILLQQKMLDLYSKKLSTTDIANQLNVSYSNVYKYLYIERNLPIKNKNRRTTYDKDFFITPSSDMYYWLGFIYADGCIFYPKKENNQPLLSIGVASKDRKHLSKFKKAIQYTGKISHITKYDKKYKVNRYASII